MYSQKSSAKAETYATTFAKPNYQPIEVISLYALTGFSAPLFSNTRTLREVLLFRVPPWPQPVGL